MIRGEFPDVLVNTMPKNVGSSGGYRAGIEWAMQHDFDWIWTLDDDSIPHRDALANLFNCRQRFHRDRQPNLLASKIIWTDGSLHPMNIQKPKLYNPDQQFAAAECGAMWIRSPPSFPCSCTAVWSNNAACPSATISLER